MTDFSLVLLLLLYFCSLLRINLVISGPTLCVCRKKTGLPRPALLPEIDVEIINRAFVLEKLVNV